jgi:hypothetical protein
MAQLFSNKLATNQTPVCPNCRKILDGFTGEKNIPTDGDISVCIGCATILQFKGKGMDIRLERIARSELMKFMKKYPDQWQKLQHYIMTIKAMNNI